MTIPEALGAPRSSEDAFRRAALFASGLLALRESPRLRDLLDRLARQLVVPMVGICIVERGYCWLPVTIGIDARVVPIENCLSALVVRTLRPHAIPDLFADPQFADSQMVRPPLSMTACAAAPLIGAQDAVLGTVIAADVQPRPDFAQLALPALERAAREIMAEAAAPHHLRRTGHATVEALEALIRQAARDGDDELVRAIDRVMRDVLPLTGVRGH